VYGKKIIKTVTPKTMDDLVRKRIEWFCFIKLDLRLTKYDNGVAQCRLLILLTDTMYIYICVGTI